jgi:putative transposase
MPLLTNDSWRELFCQALDRAIERQQYQLFAFVIMPEHVHLLVQPLADRSVVSSLLKAIKRPFSYRIKQRPGYDRNLTTPKAIMLAIDSIHNNPVRRDLCRRAVDWNWSSARHDLLPDGSPNPQHPTVQHLHPSILDEGTPMSFVRHRAKHCRSSQQWHPAPGATRRQLTHIAVLLS